MRHVALDLSLTATGFATGTASGVIAPKTRGHERLEEIVSSVLALVGSERASAVFIEGFSFASRGSSAIDIAGLGWLVRHELWRRHVPYCDVPPSVIKKYATGKGTATKDAVLAAAIRRFGFTGDDNNAADAWVLWHLGAALLGRPRIAVPATHAVSASKVVWVGRPR